jgi:glycosyltransferase involved in cell wall biosynthesis
MYKPNKKRKIALFHPWIKSKGGGEKVILEILKSKKYDFDIYTWVYDEKNTFDEFKKFNVKVIAPKLAKKLSRFYILRGFFLPISLFSKIPLEDYDLFLISTSGLGEFITFRNYKPKKTIAYVHTILRAANENDVKWNLKYRYTKFLSKLIYLSAIKIYRILEKASWKKIDYILFNSGLSFERAQKQRLLRDKKFEILHPPIDVKKFENLKTKKGDYFLYVSRFSNPKRQDVLIKAWRNFVKKYPKYKLILVGSLENKNYFNKLKDLAKETKNIEIRTNVQGKELENLYAGALACIFIPFEEDFGIVPFEILATGKPLITVDCGGYVELIEKSSQVFEIKEKKDEREFILEIEKNLEKFINSRIKSKKIKFPNLDKKYFRKRIEEVLNEKIP